MKKILSLLLALFLLFSSLSVSVFAEKDAIYDLSLDSQGVYLVNTETDTVLYKKAENARMFPASLTKVMTALLVLENSKDPKTETVTVPDTAMFSYIIEDGGVHMELSQGETFTVYDLLTGLILASYCDVADLLAYHFGGGSISSFVKKMNDRAKDLGLDNTHFENPHGLHEANHYSSPRDISVFFRQALSHDLFREIIATRDYVIPATASHGSRALRYTVSSFYENSDLYLDCYVGGKSGFTDQAGRCLVTYSTQNGTSFVSVLLGANMDSGRKYAVNMAWQETRDLLAYAYENFVLCTVFEKGAVVGEIPVVDSDVSLPAVAGSPVLVLTRQDAPPSYEIDLPQDISAEDLKDGMEVGKILLSFNEEEEVSSYPVLLSWDGVPVKTRSALEKGADKAARAISGIFREDKVFVTLFIILILLICVCLPAFRLTQRLHKKKSRRPKH